MPLSIKTEQNKTAGGTLTETYSEPRRGRPDRAEPSPAQPRRPSPAAPQPGPAAQHSTACRPAGLTCPRTATARRLPPCGDPAEGAGPLPLRGGRRRRPAPRSRASPSPGRSTTAPAVRRRPLARRRPRDAGRARARAPFKPPLPPPPLRAARRFQGDPGGRAAERERARGVPLRSPLAVPVTREARAGPPPERSYAMRYGGRQVRAVLRRGRARRRAPRGRRGGSRGAGGPAGSVRRGRADGRRAGSTSTAEKVWRRRRPPPTSRGGTGAVPGWAGGDRRAAALRCAARAARGPGRLKPLRGSRSGAVVRGRARSAPCREAVRCRNVTSSVGRFCCARRAAGGELWGSPLSQGSVAQKRCVWRTVSGRVWALSLLVR